MNLFVFEIEVTNFVNSKILLYLFVYVPVEQSTDKSFSVNGGILVEPQTLIISDTNIYLCQENYQFCLS